MRYDPDADIFSTDFEQTTPDAALVPVRAPTRGVDISEMIDAGDLLPVRHRSPSTKFLEVLRKVLHHSDLEEVSRKRLQCICRSYGLILTGRKRDLIERIVQHEATHEAQSCWRKDGPQMLKTLQLS